MSKLKKVKRSDVIRGGKVYRVVKKGRPASKRRFAIYVMYESGSVDFRSMTHKKTYASKRAAEQYLRSQPNYAHLLYSVLPVGSRRRTVSR